MYKNYIFDLYGTLVDIHTNEKKNSLWEDMALTMSLQGAAYSAKELKKSYKSHVTSQEAELREKMKIQHVEIKLENVFSGLYKDKGVKATKQMIKDTGIFFRTRSLEKIKLYPGAKGLLKKLKKEGVNVYLLSNAQRLFTEPEMKLLGIYDLFDGILYSSDAGCRKPSPKFFECLFETYELDKNESVMVGNDWEADAWGADNYGIDSIYIHTEQSTKITGKMPDRCLVIKKLSDLAKL